MPLDSMSPRKTLPLESLSLKYDGKQLLILDQRQLPHHECWVDVTQPEILIQHIQSLAVRGAPLIALSAAICLGHYCELKTPSTEDFLKIANALTASRPTAVNLSLAMKDLIDTFHLSPQRVQQRAIEQFYEDRQLCQAMIEQGLNLLDENDQILTHCNTGGLATAGDGTALGVITHGYKRFKHSGGSFHVYVDETRPLLQGARLTAWELAQQEVPHTLICDNMAASLMSTKKITKVFVGADRITTNGDFANKVGTYSLAVLCHYHQIPFYVVAPQTTVDPNCHHGDDIPIEERQTAEVQGMRTYDGSLQWAPHQTPVYNPAFDVTPAHLVTAWILDSGIYVGNDISEGALKHLSSKNR